MAPDGFLSTTGQSRSREEHRRSPTRLSLRRSAGFTEDLMVPRAAGQNVVAVVSEEKVIAGPAVEGVRASLAEQQILARTAGERVIAIAAKELRRGQRAVRLIEGNRIVAVQATTS
jgi:hypothetical protein